LKTKGYHNSISSIAYTEFYYLQNGRKVIQEFKEDIIVLSGNLYGEIPNKILNIGETKQKKP
jgi:DNA polymerase-3 subunit alpha